MYLLYFEFKIVWYRNTLKGRNRNTNSSVFTIVRVRQAVIGCFHSYFFLFVVVNSGDRLGLLFRRDSR